MAPRAALWLVSALVLLCGVSGGAALAQDDVLDVFFVPHTHDDTGWLVNVDEYYVGAGRGLGPVQYVLDTVVEQLLADSTRRFTYVEMAFFYRWYREQSEERRSAVRQLVASKQLQFANGGWCMNDEAGTHYVAVIDQMTLGHRFLLNEFSVRPRVGWHIDPFGHASTQASLFALMGFDAFYFARIDYEDKIARIESQRLNLVWQPSPSLGASADIFTGVLFHHYSPPPGFCFDAVRCDDPEVQDDPLLGGYNVAERASNLTAWARDQAAAFRTRALLLTMGDDFEYVESAQWYANMDRLIRYFAAHPELGVRLSYGTPDDYTDAVHAQNLTFTTKQDDFFPYADHPHAVWSGYFTSRPALKGYVRAMSAYLQACRHLETLAPGASAPAVPGGGSGVLARAMALAQHHDAVAGTEKQAVAFDYARRLAGGEAECDAVVSAALGRWTGAGTGAGATANATFSRCPRANESVCEATAGGAQQAVVVYNQLARPRDVFLRVPVPFSPAGGGAWALLDAQLQPLPSQLLPNVAPPLPSRPGAQNFTLFARVPAVPPLGFTTVFLSRVANASAPGAAAFTAPVPVSAGSVTVGDEQASATFSAATGMVSQLASGSLKVNATQDLLWWASSAGNDQSTQASGAYIFRPNSTVAYSVRPGGAPAALSVVRGAVLQEARQRLSPWAVQTVRHFKGSPHLEVEYQIGPVPVGDRVGKEVVSRWSTGLATAAQWWTDSQGREMIRRQRNHRDTWNYTVSEPASGNYVPANSIAAVGDARARLTVLTDRSQGCASLADGALELMLHRRLVHDDNRGVGEALDEPGLSGRGLVVRTTHRVLLTAPGDAAGLARPLAERVFAPPVVSFAPLGSGGSPARWRAAHAVNGSLLASAAGLPPQVHLLTVQYPDDLAPLSAAARAAHDLRQGGGNVTVTVRLAHMFAVGEGPLAVPVTVDLARLFDPHALAVISATETTLSTNRPLADLDRLKWNAASDGPRGPRRAHQTSGTKVELMPMDIRTFEVLAARV